MNFARTEPTARGVVQPASHSAPTRIPRAVRLGMLALVAVVAGQAMLAAAGLDTGADVVGGLVVPLLAAALVAERVRRTRSERAAWAAVVVALGFLIAGNLYSVFAFPDPANPPVPSVADIAWLAEYPLMFLALGLLVRERAIGFRPSLWIDGLVATLSVAGVWTALDPPSVAHAGSNLGALTLHAYVVGDVVLAAGAIGTFALFSWRPGPTWIVIAGGLAVQAAADLLTTVGSAGSSAALLQLTGVLWSMSVATVIVAAWMPTAKRPQHTIAGWRAQAPTVAFSTIALATLVAGVAGDVPVLARTLATAAVAAAMVRLLWTANENVGLEFARRLAVTDDLTGLGNRRALWTSMRAACSRRERFATLVIDLDGFKEVNDTLGHTAGDVLLRGMADRFSRLVRPDDVLVRLGGDEFGVLLRACDEPAAVAFADRVAGVLETGFEVHGITVRVAASVGIAIATGDDTAPELLRRADVAMSEAKRKRSHREVYCPETDQRSPARLAMTDQLRQAIESRALEIHYQPKANVRSGEVYGLEALVRWRTPEGELLLPAAFLPLANHAGLMYELTLCVLERALTDVARLRVRHPELTVAVNVPPLAILDATLSEDIARMLAAAGLPGEALEIEITEESLMADRMRARSLIAGLRELGVAISIDDYGTGYSSLPYLRDLEVDSLKLDRSYVTGLADSAKATTIVASTINLAHALGLWVVAEGVESQADRRALEALDCDAVQGYLLSRPVPIEVITDSLSDAKAA
jgi:diguanylate cyclase (GGDEF)-like protein